MCFVYIANRRRLPSTRGQLLRIFARTLYQREQDMGNECGLSYLDMLQAFGALALGIVQSKSATAVHVAWAAKRLPSAIAPEAVIQLGINTGFLRLSKNDRFLQFTHQLLLEYFAAEHVLNRKEHFAEMLRTPRFDHSERRSQPFDEVFYTLVGLGDPHVALEEMAKVDPFLAADALDHVSSDLIVTADTLQAIAKQLISSFHRQHEHTRQAIVSRLVKLEANAVEPLTELLRNGSKLYRRLAIQSLGLIPTLDALDGVVIALNDKNKWVRRQAEEALLTVLDQRVDQFIQYLTERLALYTEKRRVEIGHTLLNVMSGYSSALRQQVGQVSGVQLPVEQTPNDSAQYVQIEKPSPVDLIALLREIREFVAAGRAKRLAIDEKKVGVPEATTEPQTIHTTSLVRLSF